MPARESLSGHGQPPSVRLLTPDDAAAFRELRLLGLHESPRAFGSSFEEEQALSVEWFAARLGQSLPESENAVLGAWLGQRLAGVAGVRREPYRKAAHKAVIWGVYVRPDVRRRGLGRTLVGAAIAVATSWPGVEQINLSVATANVAAVQLYESFDFVAYGIEPRALKIDGEYVDETLMSRWLDRPSG